MIDPQKGPALIIDDDAAIVDIIERALKLKRFTNVESAHTGAEALEKLGMLSSAEGTRTAQFQEGRIIILDVMLPDTNGFELCRKIKETMSESLVMLISGHNIEGLDERLLESNADDFLTKPFSPVELVARLELLIRRHNSYMSKRAERDIDPGNQESSGDMPGGHSLPHVGDMIDNYEIVDPLGWGKSSVIYKVSDIQSGGIFALKLLTRYATEFRDVLERFKNETRIMTRISHPNVTKLHVMGNYKGCPYFIMDCVNGINLEELLMTKGAPAAELFLLIAKQTAGGIAAIHSAGIIHRDIKLKNIMIDAAMTNVKLTDFGIARAIEDDPHITRDGYIVGTPIYMAPEIFRGERSTVRSDIYSYGVTLYQLASGAPPFVGKNNSELYTQHRDFIPKPLSFFRKDCPDDLDSLIRHQCMAKAAADRPESMSAVLDALEKIKIG